MTLPKMLLLLALVTSCASAAVQADKEQSYIEVPSSMTQTLVLDATGSYSMRVGVLTRAAGPSLGQLDFKVFELQYKERQSSALLSRFTVAKQEATASTGDALVISVPAPANKNDELLPGNYVLTIHVRATSPAKPEDKTQPLVLTLIKPEAVLSPGVLSFLLPKGPSGSEAAICDSSARNGNRAHSNARPQSRSRQKIRGADETGVAVSAMGATVFFFIRALPP